MPGSTQSSIRSTPSRKPTRPSSERAADGFSTKVPYILSGEGLIIDTESYVDASIAVTQSAA